MTGKTTIVVRGGLLNLTDPEQRRQFEEALARDSDSGDGDMSIDTKMELATAQAVLNLAQAADIADRIGADAERDAILRRIELLTVAGFDDAARFTAAAAEVGRLEDVLAGIKAAHPDFDPDHGTG